MASRKQIDANRANAQKSTGPVTPEGKAASRCNALKTGIYARIEVLPTELPENLESLAAEFHEQFRPRTPEERALVDLAVRNEWLLRRTAATEAHYWNQKRIRHFDGPVALDDRDVIGRDFTRLQWRLNSLQRNLFNALDRLRALRRELPPDGPASPGLASFRSNTGDAPAQDETPAPEDALKNPGEMPQL